MIDRLLAFFADAPTGVVLFAKCLLVLLACHFLHLMLRAANPRWRVVMWRAGIVVAFALPPLAMLAPRFELAVAPAALRERAAQPSEVEAVAVAHAPGVALSVDPRPAVHGSANAAPAVSAGRAGTQAPARRSSIEAAKESLREQATAAVVALGIAVWGIVAVWLLARVLRGAAVASRVAARAQEAPEEWRATLLSLRGSMRIVRSPGLRVSEETASPMLCRVLRPAILLPRAMADEASEAKRRIVLAHELAHLQGRDLEWFAAFQVVRAVLWFVPLAWWIPRLHERACEEVADAVAADVAGCRERYARTLAQVALDAAGVSPVPAAISMAARAEIVGRLERLKKTFGTRALRRRAVAGACMGTFACAIGVAGLRVARAEELPPAPPKPPAPATPAAPPALAREEFAARFVALLDRLDIQGEERRSMIQSLHEFERAQKQQTVSPESGRLKAALLKVLEEAAIQKLDSKIVREKSAQAREGVEQMAQDFAEMKADIDQMMRGASGLMASATIDAWVDGATFRSDAIVVDNDLGPEGYVETGTWLVGEATGYNRGSYHHAAVGVPATATWTATIPVAGAYEVSVAYGTGGNRSKAAAFTMSTAEGPVTKTIDQTRNNRGWESLGTYSFDAGPATVTLDAAASSGDASTVVIADAVRFVPTAKPLLAARDAAWSLGPSDGFGADLSGKDFKFGRTNFERGFQNAPAAEVLAQSAKPIDCTDEPLDELLKDIADAHGLNIVFSPNEVVFVEQPNGKNTTWTLNDCRVTTRLSGMSLGDALTALLETYRFAWMLDDRGFVRVLSRDEVEKRKTQASKPAPESFHDANTGETFTVENVMYRLRAVNANDPADENDDSVAIEIRRKSDADSASIVVDEFRAADVAGGTQRIVVEEARAGKEPGTGKARLRVIPLLGGSTHFARTSKETLEASEGTGSGSDKGTERGSSRPEGAEAGDASRFPFMTRAEIEKEVAADSWWLEVYAGSDWGFAEGLAKDLKADGFHASIEKTSNPDKARRVLVGPHESKAAATRQVDELAAQGFLLVQPKPVQLVAQEL